MRPLTRTGLRVLLVALALSAALVVAKQLLTPTYLASLVVVSEAPITDVEVVFDGRAAPQPFTQFGPARLHAWDNLHARTTRPHLIIGWTGPDGQRRVLQQTMLHEPDEPRCVYLLQIDAAGRPSPVGSRPSVTERPIDDLCR